MITTADRLYPPAIAAEVGGINAGTLRVWQSNKQIVMAYTRDSDDRSWHRYSKVDITKIAVMRQLATYGMTVAHAGYVAAFVIHKVQPLLSGDFATIVEELDGVRLTLWQDQGKWDSVWSDAEGPTKQLPSCVITLDVGRIARDIHDKLTNIEQLSQAAQLWLEEPTF